jgi:ATP-binding cassette subfamily G (WHITE) protein 8 (sterolin 2)
VYVPLKDDRLLPNLTVRETLEYAAELRLPPSLTRQEKRQRVEMVISDLGLTHVENSIVGSANLRGISGGERRRVSIAVQLLVEPSKPTIS